MKLKVKCEICGKEFLRKKACIKEHNYCSRACLGKANAERYRKQRLMKCDNCGRQFEYFGHHKKRNEHYFCSPKCSYEFKVKKIYVSCDWCGKPIYKKRSDVERNRHNFCDLNCYMDYINFAKAGAKDQVVAGKLIHRSLAELKFGRKLRTGEEVHHIDGNHENNKMDNLMILTASEHSKLHAAQKERDCHGRFIKKE